MKNKICVLLIDFMAIPPGLWLRLTDKNELQVTPQMELATRFENQAEGEQIAKIFAAQYGKGKNIMFMYAETPE